ncbi:hypothetical protein P3L10_008240 [Capsicum annuum]|uniref:uncharacterized protein LOC107861988 n=1 Tax=Capsicum annuum TaxID=4072 RepID=UPI0007BF13DD|nr:uncharacterized protein LOC107861988 [Capsicum annuum]
MMVRVETIASLQENNREMEKILVSLKIPRIDVITLEKTLTLKFENVVREMEIILLPLDLTKFSLEIYPPSQTNTLCFTCRMCPISNSRKRKSMSPSNLDRGKTPLGEIPNPPTRLIMKCIIWNVRGANNTEFKRNYKFMVQIHQPVILGLLETRMQDHKRISKTLGFSNNIQFPATGNFGGRVLMWKDENINITEISISPQVIYTMIQVKIKEVGSSGSSALL